MDGQQHSDLARPTAKPAVEPQLRDVVLNALTVSSGAIDAISWFALGKVFSAFMTGNIAFLGLRLAGNTTAPEVWPVLIALGAFALGVYLSTQIVKPTAGPRVWTQRVTVALSVSLIPHALFVAVWFANNGRPGLEAANILLGLWSVAMGMQSAAVRRVHVDGVFTTAATATIIDLFADIASWSATGAERRRLSGVLVSLLIGATGGGVLLAHARIFAPILPLAVTIAAVVTAAIALRDSGTTSDRPNVASRAPVSGT